MGGHAFKFVKDITFPRMSPEVYRICRVEAMRRLLTVYSHVACPRKAPDKTDHGDLDILVVPAAGISPSFCDVAAALGAEEYRPSSRSDVRYFGVCSSHLYPEGRGNEWVQIDIETCASETEMKWKEWDQDFGDVTKILGSVVKPFGLTINPDGLLLHIEEIEPHYREKSEKSTIVLTSDADEAMEVLGLDVAKHHQGFETDHDIFMWITETPLWNSTHIASRIPKWTSDKCDLKRRMERELFRKFVNEWFLANPVVRPSTSTQPTRKSFLELALVAFNVREEYGRKISEHRKLFRHDNLYQKIKDTISELALDKAKSKMLENGYQRWIEVDADGIPFLSRNGGRMEKRENLHPFPPNENHSSMPTSSETPCEESAIGPKCDKLMMWLHECTLTEEQLGDWVKQTWVDVCELEKKHCDMRYVVRLAEQKRKKEKKRLEEIARENVVEEIAIGKSEEGHHCSPGETGAGLQEEVGNQSVEAVALVNA